MIRMHITVAFRKDQKSAIFKTFEKRTVYVDAA